MDRTGQRNPTPPLVADVLRSLRHGRRRHLRPPRRRGTYLPALLWLLHSIPTPVASTHSRSPSSGEDLPVLTARRLYARGVRRRWLWQPRRLRWPGHLWKVGGNPRGGGGDAANEPARRRCKVMRWCYEGTTMRWRCEAGLAVLRG
jgi:hypothetical protein